MTMKCWRRTMNMKEMNNDHNGEEQKIERLRTMKSNDDRGEEQPWRKSEKKTQQQPHVQQHKEKNQMKFDNCLF